MHHCSLCHRADLTSYPDLLSLYLGRKVMIQVKRRKNVIWTGLREMEAGYNT